MGKPIGEGRFCECPLSPDILLNCIALAAVIVRGSWGFLQKNNYMPGVLASREIGGTCCASFTMRKTIGNGRLGGCPLSPLLFNVVSYFAVGCNVTWALGNPLMTRVCIETCAEHRRMGWQAYR